MCRTDESERFESTFIYQRLEIAAQFFVFEIIRKRKKKYLFF